SLVHGTTLHGKQDLSPEHREEPLTYYHRTGPIGHVFAVFSGPRAKHDVALVGMGTGTLAAYGEPGMRLTFYEIAAAVRRIAFNPESFPYTHDCIDRGGAGEVVLGDARQSLEQARAQRPDERYGLIVVDAFSSDAIPVHLITKEALQ